MPKLDTSVALAFALVSSLLLASCGGTRAERLLDEGDSSYEAGDLDAALRSYRAALDAHPDNPRALYSIAVVHYTRDGYPEALRWIDRALATGAEISRHYLLRGKILSRLGRGGDAIPSYERAIELSPGEAEAYYAIGIAYYNRREYDRAVEWLERYLRVDPDAPNRSRVRDMIEVLER